MLSWLKKSSESPLVRDYRAGTPPGVPSKLPLDGIRFVALDAETTGFKVGADRMLSLSIIEVKRQRITVNAQRNWLIYQPAVEINEAAKVHGILPSETAGGSPEKEVLSELLPLLHGAVLVGHHINFDARMLSEALRRHHNTSLRNPMLDTAHMAMVGLDAFRKSGYPGQRPPSLEEVCQHCHLPIIGRHTAAGDAFTTAQLFLLLCNRLQRQLGRPLIARDLPIDRG